MPQDPEIKRIALIITELNPGGAERCVVQVATQMDRNHFALTVVSLAPRPIGDQDELVKDLERAQIPVVFLNAKSVWGWPRTLWQLFRQLRQQAPDLVHTFLFHANVLGTVAARLAGIQRVVTSIRVADPRASRRWEGWLSRYIKVICCVSESVAEFAVQQGFPRDKVIVIPNGIDTANYRETSSREPPNESQARHLKAAFVGRLDSQKGVDLLIEAWQTVLASLPDCHLLLIGTGPERDKLNNQIQQNRLVSRIQMLGWREDIPQILRDCDLFVLPSRWEGMPNALLEAMASGLPVVASRVEGVVELLGPSADQQTVDPHSSTQLAHRIISLLRDQPLARQLGAANRQRVTEHFSRAKMIERYQLLYERLLK